MAGPEEDRDLAKAAEEAGLLPPAPPVPLVPVPGAAVGAPPPPAASAGPSYPAPVVRPSGIQFQAPSKWAVRMSDTDRANLEYGANAFSPLGQAALGARLPLVDTTGGERSMPSPEALAGQAAAASRALPAEAPRPEQSRAERRAGRESAAIVRGDAQPRRPGQQQQPRGPVGGGYGGLGFNPLAGLPRPDLPFPILPPDQYAFELRAKGLDPKQIQAEMARYRAWYNSPEGLQSRIASEQFAAQQREMGGEAEAAQAQADEFSATSALMAQQARLDEERGQRFAATVESFKAQRSRDDAALRRSVDELDKMKIDPERYFHGENTWRAVVGGIALALSTAGTAIAGGGENKAQTMITQAIDRDIDAQLQNVAIKKSVVAERANLLEVTRRNFSDDVQAQAVARQIAFDAALNKAKQLTANTQSKLAQSASMRLTEGLEAQKRVAQLNFEYAQRAKALALQQAYANAAAAAARKSQQQPGQPGLQWQELTPEMQKRLVNGRLLAPTDDDAKRLRGLDAFSVNFNAQVDQLIALGARGGNLSSTDKALAEQLATSIKLGLNQGVFKAGAMDAGTQELLDNIVENPLATANSVLGNRSEMAKLQQLKGMVNGSVQAEINAAGGIPIATPVESGGVMVDPRDGKVKPFFAYTGGMTAPSLIQGETPRGKGADYFYSPGADEQTAAARQRSATVDFKAGELKSED